MAFKEAKDKWVKQKCGHIDGHYHHQFHTAKEAWNAISDLVRGFDSAQQVSPTRLRKFGSRTVFCTTDEEEAEAREAHFKDLLERAEPSKMKVGIENEVPQRQIETELDKPITQEEITKAIAKLKPTGPGFSGAHAACFKAIWAEGGEAAGLLKDCIMTIWEKEQLPEFWLDALLKILPKSGDKSDPSNCRGMQLLEVMYKILGNIMKVRSQQISEKLDHEAQCGFRIERGTIDGVWNIRMLVDKRREWGAETWLLLIDLVKAFDRVPRSLLWKFMQRFGYPPKFISVLKKLHTGVKVHFEVNGVQKVINSTIGGKQGDLLFPDLFMT